MLRLSKKSDYALISMKHLAMRPTAARRPAPARFPSRTTSRWSCWPRSFSASCARGCCVSVQGTRGGYRLGRQAGLISVADVIQAVDGPVTVTACSEDDHNCDQFTKCSIRDPLWKIKNKILESLNTVSVAEMAAEAEAPPPAPDSYGESDGVRSPVGEN